MKKTTVLCFGDSITEGYMVNKEASWPSVLADISGKQLIVLNHGISGETTQDALYRLRNMTALKPDIAVVEFGINDFFTLVPPEQAETNLKIIILELQATGSKVVLTGFVLTGSRAWEEMYRRLAAETGATLYADIFQGMRNNKNMLDMQCVLPDGVHPNEMGYARIARDIYNVIKKLSSNED